MERRIRILRELLVEAISNIDKGNSNHTEDELDAIIKDLTKINRGIKRISKKEACEKILKCSTATFDNYVRIGLILMKLHCIELKNIKLSIRIYNLLLDANLIS